MMRKVSVIAAALACFAGPAFAAGGAEHPHKVGYSFDGPFGKFDPVQLQRGFKVFKEVCGDCHSADLFYFRNLGQKGGPFYEEKYPNPNDNPFVKAIAAEFEVPDIDEAGDVAPRPATTADRYPNPYPNEVAARDGNEGALPPDLSVIVKARHGGADYIYSLLTGYVATPPAGLTVGENKHYNPFYPGDLASSWSGDPHKVPPGGIIAMPPPLEPGKVTFDDGTPSTVKNQARDVGAFLAWLSDPKATERKQTGLVVMIYLLLLMLLTYASYRKVWRKESH